MNSSTTTPAALPGSAISRMMSFMALGRVGVCILATMPRMNPSKRASGGVPGGAKFSTGISFALHECARFTASMYRRSLSPK